MKKNYIKPSLLSETFVAENLMSEDKMNRIISTNVQLYLDGKALDLTSFGVNNTIHSISISQFIK